MLLQKRKNIKCYSRFLKAGYIPFDKLTDFFMLCETVYHETSMVKFSDEVTHNMPVCAQPQKTSRDCYYMQHLAKTEMQSKTNP